jgi:hypothetical protein
MELNTLVHEMVHTLAAAETCGSRKEAKDLINKAEKIRGAINYLKAHPCYAYGPATIGSQVGGAFGSDDYIERWH